VKAFRFRLAQALRWRETQVNLQKARVAEFGAQVARIEIALADETRGLIEAARTAADSRPGVDMQSYAGYRSVAQVRIRKHEADAVIARRNLAIEINRLVEANQKAEVLERLKSSCHASWQHDFNHELASFADEAFLNRRS
jgi:hypothetical protein